MTSNNLLKIVFISVGFVNSFFLFSLSILVLLVSYETYYENWRQLAMFNMAVCALMLIFIRTKIYSDLVRAAPKSVEAKYGFLGALSAILVIYTLIMVSYTFVIIMLEENSSKIIIALLAPAGLFSYFFSRLLIARAWFLKVAS